jgi:hypothetical protein
MPAECAKIEMLEKDLVHLERAGKILIGWEQRGADPAIDSLFVITTAVIRL